MIGKNLIQDDPMFENLIRWEANRPFEFYWTNDLFYLPFGAAEMFHREGIRIGEC